MKILVIGANGFVGGHLKKQLKFEGHDVVSIGREPIDYSIPFDVVINCAAELTDESKMWTSNVCLVHDLLEGFRKHGIVKRIIQIGSSSEYGLTDLPRKESTICIPSNIYEATKLAATSLCQGYASRYDMDICVARPFSLYGPNDKPRKLIPTLYRSHINHASITVYPGSHDWIYIDDFINGIILIATAKKEVVKGQIFNFGTGKSTTNKDIVQALEVALGSKLNVSYRDDKKYHSYDVDNWVSDSSKARDVLGWTPQFDIKNGMREFVMAEWFKEDKG